MTAQAGKVSGDIDSPQQKEIRRLTQEFLMCWQFCTSPFPSAKLQDEPAVAMRWANIPFRFYNAVCLTGAFADGTELAAVLNPALAFMRANPQPGWMAVCLDTLSGAAEQEFSALIQLNDLTSMPATGMVGHILPLETRSHPALRLERILDEATVADFVALNCLVYDLSFEAGRALIGENTFWREHAYGFVAYEQDLPVSTATGVVCGDCIFLFCVATRPDAQRKGYADLVVRHALNAAWAATGIQRTALQATDAGRPVYARLGYRSVCRYSFLWPEPRD